MALSDEKIKRANVISIKLKNIIGNKGLTIQNVADMLGVSQPYVSQNLNGRKVPTDDFFIKVMEAIGLTTPEMKKIFQEADEEEYKYKYSEDLMTRLSLQDNGQEPITTKEEAEKVLFRLNGLEPTEEALRSVRLTMDMVKTLQGKK